MLTFVCFSKKTSVSRKPFSLLSYRRENHGKQGTCSEKLEYLRKVHPIYTLSA